MFKKKNNLKKRPLRRTRDEEDSNDDEETTASHKIIQDTKRRRQLLTALQYKRGVDAKDLVSDIQRQEANNDNEETSSPQGGIQLTKLETSKEGILLKKHQEAMENYIQEKIVGKDNVDTANNKEANHEPQSLSKDRLYKELAEQASSVVGQSSGVVNADVGLGGEIIAGTGIAEVILPIDQRLRTVKETEVAAKKKQTARFPRTAIPAETSSVPSRFAVPSKINYPQEQDDDPWVLDRDTWEPTSTTKAPTAGTNIPPRDSVVDQDRIGFDALRGRNSGPSGPKKNRASDDRLYKQFVVRHREQQNRDKK